MNPWLILPALVAVALFFVAAPSRAGADLIALLVVPSVEAA
jgi:hypothetical protein